MNFMRSWPTLNSWKRQDKNYMISKDEVNHIAKLARLGISPKEEEKFQKNLSSILDYFSSLEDADVSQIEATFHSTVAFLKKEETTRPDKAKPQDPEVVQKLIELAPQSQNNYIKVKAVF